MSAPGEVRAADFIPIERDGQRLTGINSGIRSNSFTIRRLSSGKRQSGWIVKDGSASEWSPKGLAEQDGFIYLCGPPLAGEFFDKALEDESRDHLDDLIRVSDALATLEQNNAPPERTHTREFVLLDDGGVLVVPPEIRDSILENSDINEQVRIRRRFTHPDKEGSDAVAFFIASLAFRAITGFPPYEELVTEDLNGRIRAGSPVPAMFRRYDVKPEISDSLRAALSANESASAPARTAAQWRETLRVWQRQGVYRPLTPEQRAEIEHEATDQAAKIDHRFGRSEHIRKNWRRWLIITLVILAVGSVPATILRNALQPRATAGFTPIEVVRAFYESINRLDHLTMEDAVVDQAGRSLIREVTGLYVVDRQRMAVEFQSGFVDAQVWRDEGMPDLGENQSPYGVVDLVIDELPAPEEERAFEVSYERWVPGTSDEPNVAPATPYVGRYFTDRVRLRLDREDWVIYDLENLRVEEIDVNQL